MQESRLSADVEKRLHSFTMHYLKSTELLKLQGRPKCANYPYLNNLVNGLAYVYFREITKPTEALLSKLEDKRILDCLEVYADCLSKEFVHVERSLENLIKSAYQHIDFRSLPKTYLSEEECKQGLEQTAMVIEKLLMAVVDYHKFNYQVLVHLVLKVRDQIETMEVNVSSVILKRFLQSDACNCFFGSLHVLELIKVAAEFVKQITSTAGRPWTPEELRALRNHGVRCEILTAEVTRLREQAVFRLLESPRRAIELFVAKEREQFADFEEKLSESKRKLVSSALGKAANKPKSVQGNSVAEREAEPLDHKNDISLNLGPKTQRNLLNTGKDEAQVDESQQLQVREQEEKPLENVTGTPFFWLEARSFCVRLDQPNEPQQAGPKPAKSSSAVLHLWVILARNFAFLVFYYGQLPVFWASLRRMKVPSWLLGFLFSLTTLFSLLSNYLFNKHLSDRYRLSFTLSGAVLLLAILLQVLAGGFDSVALLVLARVVAGFAEGLVTTDTYIVRVTPEEKKNYFGYLYVGSHALAISLGCGLCALLGSVVPEYKLGSLKLDASNYLSIFLLFFYVPGLLIFFACFSDPPPRAPRTTAQAALAPPSRDVEAQALQELDPYEFDLSEVHEMTVLPPLLTSKQTFDEAVQNERRAIKKQDLQDKMRYVKRYFLKDQTNYIAGYMFVMHTIHECVIIETPFMLNELKQLDSGFVGLYFFLIFPFLLSFSLGHWFLKDRYTNGHIFQFFLVALIVACLVKYQFSNQVYPLAAIFLGSTLVLALSLGAESCALSVLTELVSEHQVEKQYGVGYKKSMLVAGGRALAGLMVTIALAIFSRNKAQEQFMNAIIYGIWAVGLAVLFFFLRSVMSRLDETRL